MAKIGLKEKLYRIIFKSDTGGGRAFDIVLLIVILLSVILVILESVPRYHDRYGNILRIAEWTITIVFSLEYFLRISIVGKPWSYILSFYGLIDFLSVIPTYLSLIFTGAQGLMVIRALRLLRVFRIMKLTRYTNEGQMIQQALRASRVKISVFLFAVLMIVIIIGTLMYLVEGPQGGFETIPDSIYWAIVTLTTVGYGDLTPHTGLGKFISALVMIMGYAIIAVPTGIVTAEFTRSQVEREPLPASPCANCPETKNAPDAKYCSNCGSPLG